MGLIHFLFGRDDDEEVTPVLKTDDCNTDLVQWDYFDERNKIIQSSQNCPYCYTGNMCEEHDTAYKELLDLDMDIY